MSPPGRSALVIATLLWCACTASGTAGPALSIDGGGGSGAIAGTGGQAGVDVEITDGASDVEIRGGGTSGAEVGHDSAVVDESSPVVDASASETAPAAKFWSCPAGPFDAPQAGASHAVCANLAYHYDWNEGPTWVASQNAFFFSNFIKGGGGGALGDMIKFVPSTGACEIFIAGNGCNGLAATPDGNLVAACQKARAVMKFDLATKQGTVVADMLEGKMLDTPNDIVTHHNGTIYFTNPPNDLGGRPVGFGSALMRIDPAGMLSVIARVNVNGIAISPDERRLYVVYQGIWDLDPQGVPLQKGGAFPLGNDGLAVDCAGNVYDPSGGIHDAEGKAVGKFPGGTNMAFGGPDGKTLLVVSGRGAHAIDMNLPGLPF